MGANLFKKFKLSNIEFPTNIKTLILGVDIFLDASIENIVLPTNLIYLELYSITTNLGQSNLKESILVNLHEQKNLKTLKLHNGCLNHLSNCYKLHLPESLTDLTLGKSDGVINNIDLTCPKEVNLIIDDIEFKSIRYYSQPNSQIDGYGGVTFGDLSSNVSLNFKETLEHFTLIKNAKNLTFLNKNEEFGSFVQKSKYEELEKSNYEEIDKQKQELKKQKQEIEDLKKEKNYCIIS